ncbi:MAG: ABC transporter permease [Pseudomonadota bacterium]
MTPTPRPFRLAWRLLTRDLASGEVRVLLASLLLAVTAVTTVGFITDRAERALGIEANRLLGGDAVLRGDAPIGDAARVRAAAPGLRRTETWSFNSMARVGGNLKLADIRALGEGFPLRGAFTIADREGGEGRVADGVPAPGTVWISRAGAQALGAAVGDAVNLGTREFRLAALVLQEPDAALDYFNTAPKVFLNVADVASTGLVQEGSRVGYRLVVAGEAAAVEAFVRATRADLGRGQRLETIDDARPEIRNALSRADRFLGLAALVSVVLAAVAVAMAARRHTRRHLDGCAVMRCLGASQRTIATVYIGELAWLGLFAGLGGVAIALGLQALVAGVLGRVLGLDIPPPGLLPALQGLGVGFTVLLAFAVPPVLALRRVPALRVLRRDAGAPEPSAWLSGAAGIAGLAALVWWKAGSAQLGTVVLGGILGTLAALALLALGLVYALRALRSRLRGAWRYGLANVSRRAGSSVAQVSALGLGLMAILLLTLVRTDLLARWQAELPADAPNRFVINVQPEQVAPVRDFLAAAGVRSPELWPVVRGRLVAVNGEAVTGGSYAARGGRAQRLAEREFNLSQAAGFGPDNTLIEGRWFAGGATGPEISVEVDFAEELGWKIGDRVRFDIAGRPWEATIGSLRKVDWESFRPNFFVVGSPGSLDGYPMSHITSVHVPATRGNAANELVLRFPNLSVIDIDAVLNQVRSTADQVSKAVEYVFYFTLAAGLLVLVAAVTATQDERLLEGGVMRVLGANRRQLRFAQLTEFAAIGLLAGLVAAIAASLLSGAIATQVFDLPWTPDWRLPTLGGALGMLAVACTGMLATRRVVAAPPAQTLRAIAG